MAEIGIEGAGARVLRDYVAVAAVALAVFGLSYANGGFATTTRAYAGIAVWWLLGVGAALGIGAVRARVGRLALAAAGLFALFGIWTLISMAWAPDAERAFAQFNQVSLYVAVFAVGILLARLVPASALVGGAALALSGIAAVALVSRCFPSSFGVLPGVDLLLPLKARLSFPLGYWNGLGIEAALAYPLLLATMVSRRTRLVSALAALPLPIIGADMYLTSSRGAFVAAAVAIVVYLVLTPSRWTALAGAVLAGAGGAVAVAVLVPRKALVNGQTDTALGVSQGHHAALLIAIVCVVSAVAWLVAAELSRRLPAPPRAVGWATTGVLVLLAIAVVIAAHPVRRFQEFKSNPAVHGSSTFVTNHLLSSSGSGRWQFWGAAVSQFRAHPLNGGGAGSWQFWWLRHGSLSVYSQHAHSLWLETLGELGIVGLLLLVAAIVLAVVGAVRSALVVRSAEVAGAAAVGIAFFAAASYDWIWQLSGIAVVGVGFLGVALGALPSTRASSWGRFGFARPLLALVAVAAIVPQVVVLAAGLHLHNSQEAAARKATAQARSEALAAKAIEPWAASPYIQLARLAEAQGQYAEARHYAAAAIHRSEQDWEVWYVATQIDTQQGRIDAAKKELHQACILNPRSTLLPCSTGP